MRSTVASWTDLMSGLYPVSASSQSAKSWWSWVGSFSIMLARGGADLEAVFFAVFLAAVFLVAVVAIVLLLGRFGWVLSSNSTRRRSCLIVRSLATPWALLACRMVSWRSSRGTRTKPFAGHLVRISQIT
jgi:hypothetical protein